MKRVLFCIIVPFLFFFQYRAQSNDTLPLSLLEVADSVYGNLRNHIPSGFLLNRTLMDTSALAYNTNKLKDSVVNADYFYGLVQEYKRMALDSSSFPSAINIFDEVNSIIGGYEFENDIYVYPIGIADLNYEYLDEEEALVNDWILKRDAQLFDNLNSNDAYESRKSQLVAPLFDLYSSDIMGVTFLPQFFISNRHEVNEITKLIIVHNNEETQLRFNEVYEFVPNVQPYQYLTIKVFFEDGESIINSCKIFTPELSIRQQIGERENRTIFPVCDDKNKKRDEFTDEEGNKLEFCFINGCNNTAQGYHPVKPYILVTGYRPPIFEQSFKKTWELYSNQHKHLLYNLTLNDFDVILVRFNIHEKPYQHGMQESAELFIKFLNDLNERKGEEVYHENVIQGSSMGADIVRLALLKMEKLHLESRPYPHHHSRLYLAYDANFFGANIPLAYQYQIYSGFLYPSVLTSSTLPTAFLKSFLYATMEQKTVKELLFYHAKGVDDNLFSDPKQKITSSPRHHTFRQDYYEALNTYDTQKHFFPIQTGTRNIAISLGKISGTNDVNEGINFNFAGEYWRDIDLRLYKSQLRAGIYSSNNVTELLFKRKKIQLLPIPFMPVDHEINVRRMQEIDNAPGSYLEGLGNIISITDWSHFTLQNLINGRNFFSHKSTFTALGINPNLWPSDGSHTLDMQGLSLMFNSYDNLNDNIQSNFSGYPNLGRPNDHFNVTPFEAIYVGENIHPHIVLKESKEDDVNAINDFILNEVEPWYLGLQNQDLGAQVRNDYSYKAHRRAKFRITTGHLVTPKTDPGDYNVEPNVKLKLEAGKSIFLKPGTRIKKGAKAHLFINYEGCSGEKSGSSFKRNDEYAYRNNNFESYKELNSTMKSVNEVIVYPNPTKNKFTIASLDDVPIYSFSIYDYSGKLIFQKMDINSSRYISDNELKSGTYLLVVKTVEGIIHHKKIIIE